MKRIIAISVLALLLICFVATHATAALPGGGDAEIQRVTCIYCGGLCYTYCFGDLLYLDEGTHGIFSTCTVTAYKSRGAYQCGECGRIQQQQGYHQCINVHADCGKGTVQICVMNGGL